MKKILSPFGLKLINLTLLILAIYGFFYFETSIIIRLLVIFLGLLSISLMAKFGELLVLVTFYLSLDVLYNIRYGLAVPMSLILIAVFGLAIFLFYTSLSLKNDLSLEKDVLLVYLLVVGLILVEIFQVMSFWPVDPKTKVLTMTIVFYALSKTVYLYINNVLSLKRISGILAVSIVILGAVFSLSNWLGF
jgi:hypothetical protein